MRYISTWRYSAEVSRPDTDSRPAFWQTLQQRTDPINERGWTPYSLLSRPSGRFLYGQYAHVTAFILLPSQACFDGEVNIDQERDWWTVGSLHASRSTPAHALVPYAGVKPSYHKQFRKNSSEIQSTTNGNGDKSILAYLVSVRSHTRVYPNVSGLSR
jgi:hypothetical protein